MGRSAGGGSYSEEDTLTNEPLADPPPGTQDSTHAQGYRRPFESGRQIAYHRGNGQFAACTIGLTVTYADEPAMLVNTHCSQKWGITDTTSYFQRNTPEFVGREFYDKQFFACGLFGSFDCRRSDVTIVKNTTFDADWLKIFRATGYWSLYRDPVRRFWYVGYYSSGSVVGTVVDKMGRTIGWTVGTVQTTCVDYHVSFKGRLLCQDSATYPSDAGDSGAPVFYIYDSDASTAIIAGIHTGRYVTSLGSVRRV